MLALNSGTCVFFHHPNRLSPDAKRVLKNFYQALRRERNVDDAGMVTTRQLESLIRLSEARARMELRETVTEQDAMVSDSCIMSFSVG